MGAYTRPRSEVAADQERVYSLFPILKERRRQAAGTLSGGEQQMLAIGRAMMSNPKLLMLDEPSLGLSPVLTEKIFELVLEIQKQRLYHHSGRTECSHGSVYCRPGLCIAKRSHHGHWHGRKSACQRRNRKFLLGISFDNHWRMYL